MFVGGVIAGLVGLFALLGWWQRKLERQEREQTLAALKEARRAGPVQAHAQYPQIQPYLCIGCGSCVKACPEDGVLAVVNGVAHVVNGLRCVGHARCQEACPVGAITVGLGDLTNRPDIPILTDELESTVPGVFIAGELGGLALIRNAIEQGVRAVDAIARRKAGQGRPSSEAVDILVVGAGPAGLAAGLRAKEKGLRCRILTQDDPGGTVRKYPRRKLALVQPVQLPLHGALRQGEYAKEQLVALWDRLIAQHRLAIQTGVSLQGIQRQNGALEVLTDKGVFSARAVVLALGRRGTPRRLGVPGEEREKVLYQLTDAASYRDQRILVVGGGDSAAEAAIGLASQPGNQVHLSYRRDRFARLKSRTEERLRASLQAGRVRAILNSEVEAIGEADVTLRIRHENAEERLKFSNDFVFVFAGGEPPYPLLQKMGIRFGGTPAKEGAVA